MFAPNTVYFGKKSPDRMDCVSRGLAELVVRMANLGIVGEVKLPMALALCVQLLSRVETRLEKARQRFQELAVSRTGDERVQGQLMEVLERWFVLGREPARQIGLPSAEGEADEEASGAD